MASPQLQQRIIFGLKVRQLRQEKGWNFEELRRETGISISYLNEIEKGKKFPMPENQKKLAAALGCTTEELVSPILTKQYAPLGDLLHSNFLNELPLDLFGIELQQVVEIIARAPDRVNAFISAILEIARNYSLRDENFFFAALRAFQELHMNYFDDIEQQVAQFSAAHALEQQPVQVADLELLLTDLFGYTIDRVTLAVTPELSRLRSVFIPHSKTLMLHPQLNQAQQRFQLAKELGFNVLQLTERPLTSSLLKVRNFEETLNNYKAGYFAVSLLVNETAFGADLRHIFQQTTWDDKALLRLMEHYQVSPAVLFQRFNVLSRFFELHKVFFFRTIHHLAENRFEIDKELHLNRKHEPHASGLNEHYCRRWISVTLLQDLAARQQADAGSSFVSGIQKAVFADTGEAYLCIAVAQSGHPAPSSNVSVMVGILLDETARSTLHFLDDPAISEMTVNVTCERCKVTDCAERAAPPVAVIRREARKRTLEALNKLLE